MEWWGAPRLAAAAVAVLALPSGASAAPRIADAPASFSGALTITWHGDPARGCAAAGLCGYSGSLTVHPADAGALHVRSGRPAGFFLAGGGAQPDVVRVQRDGGAGVCTDALGGDLLGFDLAPRGGSRYAVKIASFGGEISAGRCAGPGTDELAGALPAPVLALDGLARRAVVLHWPSGPFAAGPFSGQVDASLVAHLQRLRPQHVPAQPLDRPDIPHGRRVWATTGSWHYRVTALSGELDTAFQGAGARCAVYDSCGISGTLALTMSTAGPALDIRAERVARTPPPRTPSGRVPARALEIDGELGLPAKAGAVTATVTRAGAPACTARRTVGFVPLEVGRTGGRVAFGLLGPHFEGIDVQRTDCPGPTHADVFGAGTVVRGTLPLAALGRSRLHVVLSRPGAFDSGAYTGRRSGAITLDARLVRTRALHTISRRVP